MAQYIGIDEQTVNPATHALLTTSIGCPKGFIIHREGSGILTLRGIVNNCGSFARYRVIAKSNIAVPTGETVGEISIGLSLDGEILPESVGAVTPTAVEAFNNAIAVADVTVPKGCCWNMTIDNNSDIPIVMRNTIVVVTRVA